MGRESPDEEQTHEEVRERDLVEAYLGEHALEQSLNDVINQVVADRPEDPFLVLSRLLYAKATSQKGIFYVQVQEILDARGQPTVLVQLHTGKGVFDATVSGCTGGLPDKLPVIEDQPMLPLTKQRHGGKGYRKRADKAQNALNDKLAGMEPTEQSVIDSILLALEPEVGRNICVATSVAVCKAGAKYAELPLHEYIAKLLEMPTENMCIPMPMFSIINGGKLASNKMFIQEVTIAPSSALTFADALQIGAEFTNLVKEQLDTRGLGFSNSGAFGGFTPQVQVLSEVFLFLRGAYDEIRSRYDGAAHGMTKGSVSPLRIEFGLDVSADEFLAPVVAAAPTPEGGDEADTRTTFSYNTDKWVQGSSGVAKSSEEMLDMIRGNVRELEITSVVDPFARGDVKTHTALYIAEHDQDTLGTVDTDGSEGGGRKVVGGDPNCKLQIVSRKLHELHGLENVLQERACNTIALQLEQHPSLTRALEAVLDARRLGVAIILSAQSGGITDGNFLASFAVGAGIGQVKFGGLASAECVERYNQLLLIADDELAPGFVNASYRR
ncbi:TPA: hypothetical protein N0F65_002213 [Lagenidium giganteum]|uniref:phosphopyruvate hydratase n=1 Tax=Lagenidium giganteum TaxID=4803 RepID=A0AAV2YWH3_9STRA|nr:TPA: hypothetical protein N0F65_002213 [Lagenidium giganteum]